MEQGRGRAKQGRAYAKAFTLIEVVVALAILVTGVLMLYGMYPASLAGVSSAQDVYTASQIGRDQLEIWKNKGYNWVTGSHASSDLTGTVSVTWTANRTALGSSSAGTPSNTVYTWNMSHFPIVSGGVEEVYVIVSWRQPAQGMPYTNYVRMSAWVNN